MYVIKHRCSDVTIDRFETIEEAQECIERLEACDKAGDEYEPSSYIIAEA